MLEKIGTILFSSNQIQKYKKFSRILFIIGILLTIYFPLLSEIIKPIEKQLRFGVRKNTQYTKSLIQEDLITYFNKFHNNNNNNDFNKKISDSLNFSYSIFKNDPFRKYNTIYTKNILSPRGERIKFIMINIIYDLTQKIETQFKLNFVFYSLINFLSKNIHKEGLAKDVQFNYISKELFYSFPFEALTLLTNGKFNKKIGNGQFIDYVINIDISEFDIENEDKKIYFEIFGKDSELIDLDFYNNVITHMSYVLFDEKFVNERFTTNKINKKYKKKLMSIFDLNSNVIQFFFNKKIYCLEMMNIIKNLFGNFLMINKNINANNLLISNSFNSILIKNKNKFENEIKIKKNNNLNFKIKKKIDAEKIKNYYQFSYGLETLIRALSVEEIDIFRGEYHYILTDVRKFIGYKFLFLPIF